jgi:hypothetical protein
MEEGHGMSSVPDLNQFLNAVTYAPNPDNTKFMAITTKSSPLLTFYKKEFKTDSDEKFNYWHYEGKIKFT